MHPNWKALSTLHFPPQLFVCEGAPSSSYKRGKSKTITSLPPISGEEAAHFYEKTVNTPSTSKAAPESSNTLSRKKKKTAPIAIPFNQKDFFRAATTNDSSTIERMIYKNVQCINSTDQFGWTALMMASCDGLLQSVQMLLEYGADVNIKDKKGNNALSLATKNHHSLVVKELLDHAKTHNKEESTNTTKYEEFHCDLCNQNFKEITKDKHRCSTLHQLNMDNKYKYATRYGIPDCNKGFQLMVKQGWDRDKGLGPNENGKLYPVKTVIRKYRNGIGVDQPSAKVTHFGPNDLNAIKSRINHPKSSNKQQLNRQFNKNRIKERILRDELS